MVISVHLRLMYKENVGCSHTCKVDYVTSNFVECFNAKVKSLKGLVVWEIFDKIRLMIMDKMELRKRIAGVKYHGHIIIPSVVMGLNALAKELHLNLRRSSAEEAEVSYMSKDKQEWRYPVHLGNNTCRCNQWQLRGLPCIHALYFIMCNGSEVDSYVSEYYSVAKMRETYAGNGPALLGKDQWEFVDPGVHIFSPRLVRAAGRPIKNRIRPPADGKGKNGSGSAEDVDSLGITKLSATIQ